MTKASENIRIRGARQNNLKNISLDLANDDEFENVTTEYEDKFMSQNMRIYRLEAVKPL